VEVILILAGAAWSVILLAAIYIGATAAIHFCKSKEQQECRKRLNGESWRYKPEVLDYKRSKYE